METLKDASVAITGGTGSFGSTMARHLLNRGVRQVNILSRDEAKQDALRRRLNDERVRFFLGDVRDKTSVAPSMQGVDYVFHAAALKQVPSCEFFPRQAVLTNVMGSENVIEAAAQAEVRALVCLSTDKAVYPINAMGMSKALMEKTAQAHARNYPNSGMKVAVTRYGNVMYSRGSVIPMFVDQVRSGKPLTVTDPRMTRFLMSLEDSVDLVLYAFQNSCSGDLLVKKAPASTVDVLARAVASLLGVEEPNIQVIGARHGEKMHETLLSAEEVVKAEDQGEYFRIPMDARSLQYELYFEEGTDDGSPSDGYTSENTYRLSVDEAKSLLMQLPEIRDLVGGTRIG